MEVISFTIAKGGTGKSSLSTSTVSAIFKRENTKVLLIDMDGQGNATTCMGIKKAEHSLYNCLSQNIPFEKAVVHTDYGDILGGNIFLNVLEEELFTSKYGTTSKYRILKKFINEQIVPLGYTHCIIDCPPNFGNNVTISLVASDKIIVPITPSELSMEGIVQFYDLYQSIKEDNEKLELSGILFNMCNSKTKEYKKLQSQLKDIFKEKLLDFVVPIDQKIVESQNNQNFKDNIAKPCTIAFPYCRASLAIEELVDLLLKEGK